MTDTPTDTHSELLAPWACRAIYLWAGEATIDLLREKMPDIVVDETAHREAYSQSAAAELARLGFTLAFVSMNWGFPPEIEQRHWAEFARTTEVFRDAGLSVLGYVQASNCVAKGSYATRDWYARTPHGHRIPYFRRRLMTCWNHPDWLAEVAGRAERVMAAGASGVYFDNPWLGATPWMLGGRVGGFAGCACARCREAFLRASGHRLPHRLGDDARSTAYLGWRAALHTQRLSEWAGIVRRRAPQAPVLINNCDVILRDSRALFGLDLRLAAAPQSGLLVENVAMPRYEERTHRLVANALVIKSVRATAPGRPFLALPYEHGIGLDTRPSLARCRRTIAESAAAGAAPVVKGSEYLDTAGRLSVITSKDFALVRKSIAPVLRFIADNPALFRDLKPDAQVAIYYDVAGMTERWTTTAPPTFALALALLERGVPFRFVTSAAEAQADAALRVVLAPPGVNPPAWPKEGRAELRTVPRARLDVPARPSRWLSLRLTRRVVDRPMRLLATSYFASSRVRRTIDGLGLAARFLQSPLFQLPRSSDGLEKLLPPLAPPRVECATPILAERWSCPDGRRLLHLVNYDDLPATVHLRGWSGEPPELHTPDAGTQLTTDSDGLHLQLECYAILEHRHVGS